MDLLLADTAAAAVPLADMADHFRLKVDLEGMEDPQPHLGKDTNTDMGTRTKARAKAIGTCIRTKINMEVGCRRLQALLKAIIPREPIRPLSLAAGLLDTV